MPESSAVRVVIRAEVIVFDLDVRAGVTAGPGRAVRTVQRVGPAGKEVMLNDDVGERQTIIRAVEARRPVTLTGAGLAAREDRVVAEGDVRDGRAGRRLESVRMRAARIVHRINEAILDKGVARP